MKFVKNKIIATAITLLLALSLTASITSVSAHTPAWQLPTYMYINVAPNPIGVGQTVFVNFWLNCPPPTAVVQYGDRWQNMTVKVTDPEGNVEILGPFTTDSTGGTSTTYTPDKIGNYTFQSFFGGQTLAGVNPVPGAAPSDAIGDYYKPSESSIYTLKVQEQAIATSPTSPLPAAYWTRPIYAENNNWYSIAGNWLGFGCGITGGAYNATTNYNPYSTAPTTGHILWTKAEAIGGTMGGEFGESLQGNFYSTAQYEVKFAPVILNGVLYYTEYPGSNTYPTAIVAVDLRTGEELWRNDATNFGGGSPARSALTSTGLVTTLKCGQILNFVTPNQYGGLAYLWTTGTPSGVTSVGTTYNLFDAMTGKYILSVVNCTAFSAFTEDEQGNMICYAVNSTGTAKSLTMWNSTLAIMNYGFQTGVLQPNGGTNNAFTWRPPTGGIVPYNLGIQWSAPIANNITGNPISLAYSGMGSGVILMAQYGTVATGVSSAFQNGWIVEAAYSTKDGSQLWLTNRTEPANTRVSFGTTSNGNSGAAIGNGVFVECNLNTYQITAYSLFTGKQVWGPKDLPNVNDWTSLGVQQIIANGTMYIWTMGGDAYAVNLQNCGIKWQYLSSTSTVESPYGIEALWTSGGRGVLAGGLLFLAEGHEFAPPLYHGAQQIALNITTGELVWSIDAFDVNGVKAVAEGILTTLNAYDNQIYAYGQGATKMTVNAPNVGVTTKTPIMISGRIADISAGANQEAVAANFPNGLPCVSDASMSSWMEYVYMQQPAPTNATGVAVTIDVQDANGNFRNIGTTTTDTSGAFGFEWTPDIEGKYTVIATFAGSGAYYASSSQTYFVAGAPEPTATPQPEQAPSIADQYFVPAIAGLFLFVAVMSIVTILVLRKR